jgi:site-specific recombinase XerD
MTQAGPVGPLLHSYFADHLVAVKGLRPTSVRSYRDTIRLLLMFAAADKGCKITRLQLADLTFDRVLGFLRHLEADRGNHVRTRNQRLAAVHSLFEYLASRDPELLGTCQQVAAIPMKRAAPAETRFLEKEEVEHLLADLPARGRLALRDRALVLFLYNTGARVQEAADLRAGHLDLGEHPLVRLHGKGDKWRTCPLWRKTADLLDQLLQSGGQPAAPDMPVFSARGQPLTRFGIYKIIRRHGARLDDPRTGRRISPHIFRHSAAVHLLEAGVEVNVIRGWLGHADLSTTNRYAEINTKTKQAALRVCEPPGTSAGSRATPIWRSDETLLNWLASL